MRAVALYIKFRKHVGAILTMERDHRIYDQIARLCHEVGAIHASDYAGTTLDTPRLMVTTGMGMSLLPALYVRSDVLRETLVVARRLTREAPTRDLTMCWRASSSCASAGFVNSMLS